MLFYGDNKQPDLDVHLQHLVLKTVQFTAYKNILKLIMIKHTVPMSMISTGQL